MSDTVCPICHYPDLAEPPYSDAGASYEICPSCGFEFGVTDDDLGVLPQSWRRRWIEQGCPWTSSAPRPEGWDGARQLRG